MLIERELGKETSLCVIIAQLEQVPKRVTSTLKELIRLPLVVPQIGSIQRYIPLLFLERNLRANALNYPHRIIGHKGYHGRKQWWPHLYFH